jgi:REP element-mobilizing transposase RayT
MHQHLRRLDQVWVESPIYYITICTLRRRPLLASHRVADILIEEWTAARSRHGWAIGRYVIMPDHVHFFCASELDAKRLSTFLQRWKEWTCKRVSRITQKFGNMWQEEFFDHVLRSDESYGEKWEYVRQNPVRAGLVKHADEWLWQGEIESLTF